MKKEASCGKGQSSQEASQQPTGPWAALLVARWLPQQPSRAAREFCWPASRQASGQHAHPMARQAGCQRKAGQPGSWLWRLASHRAILDDSIAKPARPRKNKRLRESPDPGKQNIFWLTCQSATEAGSNAAQLCTKQFARRLAIKPGPTFGPSALSGTSHPIGRPAARALRQ